MKCLSCGDNVCWVITKNTAICDKCGAEHTQEGLFWNCCLLEARAEKAEAELEAIKERIEAVEPSMISNIMATYLNGYDLSFATIEDEHACCEEILETIIKQIGGEK